VRSPFVRLAVYVNAMPLRRWSWHATRPHHERDGWRYEVLGTEPRFHGPFLTEELANAAALRLFQRWQHKAREVGGRAWKHDATTWCVELPLGVETSGRPWTGESGSGG
jgi:hypothetical protein